MLNTLFLGPAARSLSFKFGVALVLVLLLGVGGMGAYASFWARRSAVQHELNDLRILSETLATRIDRSLATGRGLAGHLANTRDVQDYLARPEHDPATQQAFLAWLDLQGGLTRGLSAVFVMSPRGVCLASSNRAFLGHDFSFRSYYQEAIQGHAATSDWIIGTVTHTPRIFSAAPVFLHGRVAGVLVTEFLVEDIEAAIHAIGERGRTAVVINALGIAVAHSDPARQYHALLPLDPAVRAELLRTRQFLDKELPLDPLSASYAQAFKRVLATGQVQSLDYRLGDTLKRGILTPLVERPWVVMVSIPEAEILLPVHRVMTRTLLVGSGFALGLFLLSLALGRSLIRPVTLLSDAMGRFASGDASARAPVLDQDERGRLAAEFNALADALQAHQEHLEDLVSARTLDLENSLAEVRTLRGMIPICGFCKQIRDDEGSWWQLERYIRDHSEADFSHGICPDCRKKEFPELEPPRQG